MVRSSRGQSDESTVGVSCLHWSGLGEGLKLELSSFPE